MARTDTNAVRRLQIWQEISAELREGFSYATPLGSRIEGVRHADHQDLGIKVSLGQLLDHLGTAESLAIDLNAYALREPELTALSNWFCNLTALFLVNVVRRDDLDTAELDFGFERHSIIRQGDLFLHRIEHNVDGAWVNARERLVSS